MENKLAKDKDTNMALFRTQIEQDKGEFSKCLTVLTLSAKELREIAEVIDEHHKKATIVNITGSSASITGGILSIAGIIAAPFTLGTSLALTGVGAVLNVAGSVTNIGATATDCCKQKANQKRVSEILEECQKYSERLREILHLISSLIESSIKNRVADVKVSAANCGTKVANATLGTAAVASSKVLSKAATKSILRSVSGGLSGVLIVWDACSLAKESIDIYNGSETEVARNIREAAKKIEEEALGYENAYKKLEKYLKL